MALFNFAKTYDEIKHALEFPVPDKAAQTGSQSVVTGDFAKIFFSEDGHIITHGVDYTPEFRGGYKGLVPTSDYEDGQVLKFLGNDGFWKQLTLAELPIASNINDYSSETLFTSQQIHDHFQSQLSAVDAMRFKGVIDPSNAESFPPVNKDGQVRCEIGDTYRASAQGTYAGIKLQTGDLLICVKESPANSNAADIADSTNGYWTVVQTNINGTATHFFNGSSVHIFTDFPDADQINIYAPTSKGVTGQVLVSQGSQTGEGESFVPIWVDQSSLMAGSLTDALKDIIIKNVEFGNDGSLYITDLKDQKTLASTATGTWAINIDGVAREVGHSLKLGAGLKFASNADSYNGVAERQILLTPATETVIGGVIVDGVAAGTGGKVGNTGDEYKKTISVTANGNIYLTDENIINALGYKPGATENVNNYNYFFAKTADAKESGAQVNPFFNMTAYNEKTQQMTVASSVQFKGANGITVQATDGNVLLVDIEKATDTVRGGIKVGYTEVGKTYAVKLDANEHAYVEVPWLDTTPAFSHIKVGDITIDATADGEKVDDTFELVAGNGVTLTVDSKSILIDTTTYGIVSSTEAGLAPKMTSEGAGTITANYHVLSYSEADQTPRWNALPDTAFSDTWRKIFANGVEILNTANDGKGLNFLGSGKTEISVVEAADYQTVVVNSTWRDVIVDGQAIGDDHALRISSSEDIYVTGTPTADGESTEVIFEILWHNLSTGDKETVQ